MSDDVEAIRFQAQVFKIATLIDGGLRLTLDLSATDPAVIVALFDAKQPGVLLEVAAVAILIDKQQGNNAIQKRTERKSEWTTAEEAGTN